MYEIYMAMGLARLLIGTAEDQQRAKSMAAKWSRGSEQEIHVSATGELNPCSIFVGGRDVLTPRRH